MIFKLSLKIILLAIVLISCNFNNTKVNCLENSDKILLEKAIQKISEQNSNNTLNYLDSIKPLLSKNSTTLSRLNFLYASYYEKINKDSSIKYCDNALTLLEKQNSDSLLLTLYLLKANLTNDDSTYVICLKKADVIAKNRNDFRTRAYANRSLGEYFLSKDNYSVVQYLDTAAYFYIKVKEEKQAALIFQNTAFLFDEKKNKYKQALDYAEKSLVVWRSLKDTLNEANILKYLGMLQGKVGEYAIAKKNIYSAIEKYNSQKNEMGVAVSFYDLGLVYDNEKKADSALFYLFKSKAMWGKFNNPMRIFIINNAIFHIYTINNSMQEAIRVYESNDSIAKISNIPELPLLDFYKYSKELFLKKGDKVKGNFYITKYETLKNDLTEKGIIKYE